MNRDYVVLDLETSSLDPQTGEIVSIGILKHSGGVVTTWDQIIRTVNPISEFTSALTGITNDDINHGVPITEAMNNLVKMVDNLPIVGHNVIRFDRRFLLNNIPPRVAGIQEFPLNQFIDTAGLFKGMRLGMSRRDTEQHWQYVNRVLGIRWPGLKYSLGVCCRYFGIEYDEVKAHSASYDVRVTDKLFQELRTIIRI